ncbi:MAG: AraC family transcriptional regulator [Candidatus Brocadiia bacterium]
MDSPAPNAIVMQAGFPYVGPGRREVFPTVYSRPVVRCIGGEGEVLINGEAHELKKGNVVFMPWAAAVTYRTPPEQSMVLCSCHVIPEFVCDGEEFTYAVAHREGERDTLGGLRSDATLPGLEGVQTGYEASESPLRHLTNYIAHKYARQEPHEWEARHLARLLLQELREHFSRQTWRRELSQLMQQALEFIDENYARAISTRELARHLECSPSTVARHFRTELGQTPVERIHKRRIRAACRLLATSRRYVGEIARMVGIDNPYYFSRLFRRYRNMTPTEYRQRNMVF